MISKTSWLVYISLVRTSTSMVQVSGTTLCCVPAFITVTVIKSMNSLGPAKAAMLIVISQLIIAYVIELLGWFGVEKQPLTMRKVAGMAIAIIGVVIFEK